MCELVPTLLNQTKLLKLKKILDELEHIPDLKCVPDLECVLDNKNIFLILNVLLSQYRFRSSLFGSNNFKNAFFAFSY